VAESRTEQDRLDLFIPEKATADFQGLSLVLNYDHIQLVFAGVDRTAMLVFVRVRGMSKKSVLKAMILLRYWFCPKTNHLAIRI